MVEKVVFMVFQCSADRREVGLRDVEGERWCTVLCLYTFEVGERLLLEST